MARLDLVVTSGAGAAAYWVDVQNVIVPTVGGRGSVTLDSGTYALGWRFVGDPGSTLKIVGSIGGNAVVTGQGKIPMLDTKGHGAAEFRVPT